MISQTHTLFLITLDYLTYTYSTTKTAFWSILFRHLPKMLCLIGYSVSKNMLLILFILYPYFIKERLGFYPTHFNSK